MSNRPRKNIQPASRPLTKRQQAWQQRETNVQRRVVLAIAGAVFLAFLIIVAGVVYDRFWVPGRTLKSVDGQTLSRGDYDQILRNQTLQQLAQSLQFTKLVGPNASFGEGQGSFTQQVIEHNQRLATIGTVRGRQEPVEDTTVSNWVDRQLIEQAAREQFGIDPSQGEVDQLIVERLGSLLVEPEPLTPTLDITPTTGLTPTDTLTETAASALDTDATTGAETATSEPQATAEATPTTAVTPTAGPTQTPAPTMTPSPSPLPDVATDQVARIVDVLYDEYQAILNDLPREASADVREPHATEADFASALRAQYRDELIRTRVKEQLVSTVNAEDTTTPEQISARHILLKVPKPEPTPTATPAPESTATAAETATAGVDATTEATAGITTTEEVTPTVLPTPTLAPEALEALFAERKEEADAIYEQVTSDPEQFAELAREFSEDEGSAEQGGDLGSFGRGQMVAPFEESAFALAENEISPPVRSEFGWHIIQRLPEDPEAKLERQREAAFEEWLSDLRANATIVPAPTPTQTTLPLPMPLETETAPQPGATEALPAETPSPDAPLEPAPEATTTAP